MCFRPRYSETAAFARAFVRWRTELPSGRCHRTSCNSWYLDKNGLPGVWPDTPAKHCTMLARPHSEDYVLRAAQ